MSDHAATIRRALEACRARKASIGLDCEEATAALDVLLAELREREERARKAEREAAELREALVVQERQWLDATRATGDERQQLRDALRRATHLAEHLFQMIDPQTWRDSGGDDGQGHYEGDYHAEKTRDEIATLAELAGKEATTT